MNKVSGTTLIILGALFGLSLIGQVPTILKTVLNLFNSDLSGYEKGEAYGQLTAYIGFIIAIFFSFKYGLRLLKREKGKNTNSKIE